jgi:carboxymethylenebutenolidase
MDEPRDPSRRKLLAGAVGSGFALAVQPVAADTISTSASGLDAADTRIAGNGGEIPAYVAAPKGMKRAPLVLVVHEIFGVHEHIKDVCRRLARAGYCAVAPELFARQGDVKVLASVDEIRKVVARVPDAQVLLDLDACVAWAEQGARADTTKLGITGFCWGGRATWLYAAHRPSLKAAVAWYGRLSDKKDALHPQHPLDVATLVNAPVLGLYGGKDQAIPLTDVEAMKQAIANGGPVARASTIVVYPEAGHAFLADYRPSYEPKSAKDGWARMLAWLKKHGV